jgi:uncharacterized protein (TIGR03437 family)
LLLAVVSSFSFGFAQYVNNAAFGTTQVAPGSLVKIYWSSLSGAIISNPQSVHVDFQPQGSDQLFNAQVLNSAQYPMLVVAPKDIPPGEATVTLTLDSAVLATTQVRIVPASIGIFSASGNGLGPAVAQNISNAAPPVLNQLTSPALPSQYVTLWATGLGNFTTPDVTVSIAGKLVQPSFAGHAPGLPGVDQINFNVPGDVAFGCYVPVSVSAGNYASNSVTIALAEAAGACSHPLGLSADDLLDLDQGGSTFVGSMNFGASISTPGPNLAGYTRFESFQADFRARDAFEMFLVSPKLQTGSSASPCGLSNFLGLFLASRIFSGNAGPSLTLKSPANVRVSVPGVFGSEYFFAPDPPPAVATAAELPPPFFEPGPWQVTAPGGDTVGAFQQTNELPPQVRWTNRESLTTFSRDGDLRLTWDPQGYSATDVMNIVFLTGSLMGISCVAPAQTGELIVPAALLQQIAAGPGSLELYIASQTPTVFKIPLTAGGVAPVVISYGFSNSLAVTVQ